MRVVAVGSDNRIIEGRYFSSDLITVLNAQGMRYLKDDQQCFRCNRGVTDLLHSAMISYCRAICSFRGQWLRRCAKCRTSVSQFRRQPSHQAPASTVSRWIEQPRQAPIRARPRTRWPASSMVRSCLFRRPRGWDPPGPLEGQARRGRAKGGDELVDEFVSVDPGQPDGRRRFQQRDGRFPRRARCLRRW